MSFMLKTRELGEISNSQREYFLSSGREQNCNFKHIPEGHFNHIIKNVQRQRCKEDEERIWTLFVKEQELNNVALNRKDINHLFKQSVKDTLRDRIQDVDRELKRLEEDALPELQNKRNLNWKSSASIKDALDVQQVNGTANGSLNKNLSGQNSNAYRPNIAISVSEEHNPLSICNGSQGTQRTLKTNVKKSFSTPSVLRQKCYARQLLCKTNNIQENSSPESSVRCIDNDEGDNNYVRPDPLMIQKILSMQKKIAELLDEISFRLCKIPMPDGDNDFRRRQQRNTEFAVRFSRNYLYDLNRLVTSIRRHLVVISARTGLKQSHKNMGSYYEAMEQKLIAVHRLLIHALNAYCNHIPSSVIDSHAVKLNEVLRIVIELKNICDKVQVSTNYFSSGDADVLPSRKELQEKCDNILSLLRMDTEDERRLLVRKRSSRKNLSRCLSMYSMDMKTSKRTDQTKKSYTLQAERRYGKSKIKKTECERNRLTADLLYPSPATHSSHSKDILRASNVKCTNYPKEDDVKTMMDEMSFDSENDSNVEAQSKCDNVISMRQKPEMLEKESVGKEKEESKGDKTLSEKETMKEATTITENHLLSLVPVIADLMSLVSKKNELGVKSVSEASTETVLEFLQKCQSQKDSSSRETANRCWDLTENDCKRPCSKANGLAELQKRNENMQLICVSSEEKSSNVLKCKEPCGAKCNTVETIQKRRIAGSSGNNRIELTISKESELHFFRYRREYQKLCQSRSMYTSNTKNKPWDIVAWIADNLVEELVGEIAKELQMDDVIQTLFDMEFREF